MVLNYQNGNDFKRKMIMKNFEAYLSLFIDQEYPKFIDKYLKTKTMKRIQYVTQFCGCDYTRLYHPQFLYTRYHHSLVVAHMTWHFTHEKKQTIAALLHDVGTPCFAHSIDFALYDFLHQEKSERKIADIIEGDRELLQYLKEDGMTVEDLEDLKQYPILENKTPKLCTDRLDGVFHTCTIWLSTHSYMEIKEVYHHIEILTNEEGNLEIGFCDLTSAEVFAHMTSIYAKELQGNRDKYVLQFVAEIVKSAIQKNLITFEDLYHKKEGELVSIFKDYYSSWKLFEQATTVKGSNQAPDQFYISISSKKRNVIPLIQINGKIDRIVNVSNRIQSIYNDIFSYQDLPFSYVDTIKEIDPIFD